MRQTSLLARFDFGSQKSWNLVAGAGDAGGNPSEFASEGARQERWHES
jgi:hypothetical protein